MAQVGRKRKSMALRHPCGKIVQPTHDPREPAQIHATPETQARRKAILGELVAASGGNEAVICGRKLTLVKKAGSVSYAAAVKELAPNANLDKWRGEPSSYWLFK